jgi:hypothetical protein
MNYPQGDTNVDLITGNEVAAKTEEIRFEMKAPGTRVFQLLEAKP